jgi:hypothetical protein
MLVNDVNRLKNSNKSIGEFIGHNSPASNLLKVTASTFAVAVGGSEKTTLLLSVFETTTSYILFAVK